MVTAAVEELPLELIEQLAVGGKMLVPVGPREVQELMLIRRKPDGTLEIRTIEMVRFVELKGKYGWNREE
jgi:protein-L-isoaspartate(D-aspartate) O-methyltransferase